MTRFVLLSRDLPPGRVGGVASWTDDLARALVEDGREVEVYAESRSVEADPDRPYMVHPVRGRSWARWQSTWMAMAAGRAAMGAEGVVIAATWRLATVLVRLGSRVLVGAHGSDITRMEGVPAAFAALRDTVDFLPVSQFLAGRLVDLGVSPTRVHPLPWPLRPVEAGARTQDLVMVARLVDGKGLHDAAVLAQRLGRRLTVVGEGPARADVARWCDHRGVDVQWLGARSRHHARQVVATAAAVVLLSEPGSDEGLGLTALEAAAAGVPAIGRDVGGVREAVGPGVVLAADADVATVDLAPIHALLADPSAGRHARVHLQEHHGPRACLATLDRVLAR